MAVGGGTICTNGTSSVELSAYQTEVNQEFIWLKHIDSETMKELFALGIESVWESLLLSVIRFTVDASKMCGNRCRLLLLDLDLGL